MLLSYHVEQVYLFDDFVVEGYDIMRLDIGGSVLLEEGEQVSKLECASKNRCFFRVQRRVDRGGVGHVEIAVLAVEHFHEGIHMPECLVYCDCDLT